MFQKQNLCLGNKNFEFFFFVAVKQDLFLEHVSHMAKLTQGNICFRNNVSATMFPSLARPFFSFCSFLFFSFYMSLSRYLKSNEISFGMLGEVL